MSFPDKFLDFSEKLNFSTINFMSKIVLTFTYSGRIGMEYPRLENFIYIFLRLCVQSTLYVSHLTIIYIFLVAQFLEYYKLPYLLTKS
jgi:hypothetical protein